jgi:hypothetical protein
MTEVIQLFPELPPEPKRLWVCQCGCSTFHLLDDGSTECANCEAVTGVSYGGWEALVEGGEEVPEGVNSFCDVQGDGPDFAHRRLARLAGEEDTVGVVVVKEDGAISLWSRALEDAHIDWMQERLDRAKDLAETLRGMDQ